MMNEEKAQSWHRSLRFLLDGLIEGEVLDCDIEFVTMDSRKVRAGTLFLATSGLQRHGLEFAQQAWAGGACAIVYEPGAGVVAPLVPKGKVCFAVENLSLQASEIAARFFARPSSSIKVCGTTGTNGKTTITHLISTALRFVGQRCAQMGTIGYGLYEPLADNDLTTPDAVTLQQRLAWLREQRSTHLSMEVSSHALDQGRVQAVDFDCAVFTNLSRDHLDYHHDIEAYATAKQQLFEQFDLQRAIINIDDAFGRSLASAAKTRYAVSCVATQEHSVDDVDCTISATSIETHPHGLRVEFAFTGSVQATGSIDSTLLGEFNATNLLQALVVLVHWGVPVDQAANSLASVRAAPGRMESFGRKDDVQVVVDYAHTPDALANAVAALKQHCHGKLWCVFGCGGDRDRGKRSYMAAAASHADHVIVTNDNPRHEEPTAIIEEILEGFEDRSHVEVQTDREQAIALAVNSASRDDIVLIAGKGHENYQVIGNQKIDLNDRAIVMQLLKEGAHG